MTTTTSQRSRFRFLPDDAPAFYNAETLAPILGVSAATVRWYRHVGRAPDGFTAGGRTVLYAAADVDRWLGEQRDTQLGASQSA